MRRQTVRAIFIAVVVVALMMGIPGAAMSSRLVISGFQRSLDVQTQTLLRSLETRAANGQDVTQDLVDRWARATHGDTKSADKVFLAVSSPEMDRVASGQSLTRWHFTSIATGISGATVRLEMSADSAVQSVVAVIVLYILGLALAVVIGWGLANRLSRRLSAPLIYLAAQAEQIGSGQVRARVRPSGIEEIDLVQEELVRTGERMAGRLAAERQFAADASHQLRTPLTALSMRLEEIQMISHEDEVREEAEHCLEQVERLTGVVHDLLDSNKRGGGSTEAIHLAGIFNELSEEWEEQFIAKNRELIFSDQAGQAVLADEAKLTQILATLIENSLKYGEGTACVTARKGGGKRGVIIEVADEGPGVDDDLAPDIFEYGVSGHGSTGIGLGLAHDLASAMGGRLALAQNSPPIFTVSLAALPESLDPDRVIPEGPLVSVGRRSRRF